MCEMYDDLPQRLYLIDLPQSMDGFRCFISAWFFVDPQGRHILVDPGPANTIPFLIEKLHLLTKRVDLVLLTHIHLDHSGGIGHFCEVFNEAKVIAHHKAIKHLINPEKLWASSLETLGEVALMYGEQKPIIPEKLLDYDSRLLSGIKIMETPGHAPHHLCFIVPFGRERLFFLGEASGIRMLTESGNTYIRPASPVRFDAPAALKSLEEMEAAILGDELLCYAHYGATTDAKAHITSAKDQINFWLEMISGMQDSPLDRIAEYLISNDPLMAGFSSLPEDIRLREKIFLQNNIKGFVDYLSNCCAGKSSA